MADKNVGAVAVKTNEFSDEDVESTAINKGGDDQLHQFAENVETGEIPPKQTAPTAEPT